ncbi:hypothetical protein ACUSIJ_22690 [Pseudochelatococcus sp. B33]
MTLFSGDLLIADGLIVASTWMRLNIRCQKNLVYLMSEIIPEHFRLSSNRENSPSFWFDAFSLREAVSTALENTLCTDMRPVCFAGAIVVE